MILDMSIILEEIAVQVPGAQVPKTFAGDHCQDCGKPISSCSRGRCKPCGDLARARAMPADFARILSRVGSSGAARHYRASLSTITKWRAALAIKPHTRMVRPLRQTGFRKGWGTERPVLIHLDHTAAGQAADFLRKWLPVSRCDAAGKYTAKGDHWRVGNKVQTADEVMHRAKRLGFEPVRVF